MPLAFTQEDCLVFLVYFFLIFNLNCFHLLLYTDLSFRWNNFCKFLIATEKEGPMHFLSFTDVHIELRKSQASFEA